GGAQGKFTKSSWLQRFCIHALPQIPASHAAVWLPALRNFFHLLRSGKFDLALRAFPSHRRLFPAEGLLDGLRALHIEIVLVHRHSYAEVSCGQYIFAL